MPKQMIVAKALDVVNNIFKWFSADERRKRRILMYEDNLREAVNLQERHYDELMTFLGFIDSRIKLTEKKDKQYLKAIKRKFKKSSRRFKELT